MRTGKNPYREDSPDEEQQPKNLEGICHVLKCGRQKVCAFARRNTRLDANDCNNGHKEPNESNRSLRPTEANALVVEHLVENDRVQYAAECRSRSDDTHRHRSLLVEVVAHHCRCGRVQKARCDATKNPLAENELPVLVAQTGQQHCEYQRRS